MKELKELMQGCNDLLIDLQEVVVEGKNLLHELGNNNIHNRRTTDQFLLIAGVKNDLMAKELAKELNQPLVDVEYIRFQGATLTGGETKQTVKENIAGKHCFVIWSVTETNDELIQIYQLIDALVACDAAAVHLVAPRYPYALQDKRHGMRECISAELVARFFKEVGLKTIIYVDIHADQIEGFFTNKVIVRGLWMDSIIADYVSRKVAVLEQSLQGKIDTKKMFALDEGGGRLNYRIAKTLRIALTMNIKSRDWSKQHDTQSHGIAGKVKRCLLIARDDLIASGGSVFSAAKKAKESGAEYVIAFITHPICFDKFGDEKNFVQKLNQSEIDELIVCNTSMHFQTRLFNEVELQEKISMIDVTPYLAVVIKRLRSGDTIRDMIRDIPAEQLYREAFTSRRAREYWDAGKMLGSK